jgi:hypothetical protein
MKRILAGFLLAVLSTPAVAQVQLIEEHVVDTRFGQVQVIGGDVDQQLWFAGEFLPLPVEQLYWIRGVWAAEGADHDWVLATSNHFGNMCGGYLSYYLIRAGADGAAVSPPLDACMGVLDVRAEPDRIELDLTHADLGIARETFAWDGVTLTSTLVPQGAAEAAGPGEAVTRWIGGAPHAIFEDPSERARFGSIMAPDDIQVLSEALSLGQTVEERDGWVVGYGCRQHLCNALQGAWAIRVSDGAVAAAILTYGSERLYGATDTEVFAGLLEHFLP